MKIQLPDTCPVCGAEKKCSLIDKVEYMCGLYICFIINWHVCNGMSKINIYIRGKCDNNIMFKFGTAETTGYEVKDNEKSK